MKQTALALLLSVALATPALAGPPLDGNYKSTDLGGSVLTGRYAESWLVPNGLLDPATTLNCASWDGATLGTQWRYYCGTMVAPAQLISDNLDVNGNGSRTYMKTFVGGYVWLDGAGPWGNGDPDYPGTLQSYVEFETIQYVAWDRVAAVTNVSSAAHFTGYSLSCMTFAVGNGAEVGSTDYGMTKPADYPDFMDANCNPIGTLGGWWDFIGITLSITGCTVPVEETTWGAVKAIYGE